MWELIEVIVGCCTIVTLGAMMLANNIASRLEPPEEIEAQVRALEDEKLAIKMVMAEGFKGIKDFGDTDRARELALQLHVVNDKLIKLAGKRRWKKNSNEPSDSKS